MRGRKVVCVVNHRLRNLEESDCKYVSYDSFLFAMGYTIKK